MIESKVIEIVKTFTRSELARWRDFVRSPYHNKNKYVIGLAYFIEKRYPKFHPGKTTKESAFMFIFPGHQYDDLRMRHLMSVLLKVTEQFLIAQNFSRSAVSGLMLLEEYNCRNLGKHFHAVYRQTADLQSNQPADLFHHYYQYRVELAHEQHLDRQQGRRKHTGLQKVMDQLDSFYIINKLRQSCAAISQSNVFGQQFDLHLLNELLAHLHHHSYDIPLLSLYYSGLLTLMEPGNEAHFSSLKENLKKHQSAIGRDDAVNLHVLARNYAIKRVNTGHVKYLRELFELYKLGLHSIVLDDSGYMPASSFKNLIAVGLKLKEYKWTEKFIREFSGKMEEQYQKDYLNYNLARLFFEKKEFGKVTDRLLDVEYRDIFIATDARTLLIKTYYEMDAHDLLQAQLDSFIQFVRRKKELAYHSKNYLNTVRYTKYLVNLKQSDKLQGEKLKKKIEAETMLTEKPWLIEKLARKIGRLSKMR